MQIEDAILQLGQKTTCWEKPQATPVGVPQCRSAAILRFMKATVTITGRGVVTLPAKLRAVLGIKAEDQLIAEATPHGLLLRPAVTLPVENYTPLRERAFDDEEADLAAAMALHQAVDDKAKPGAAKTTRRRRAP